MPTQCSEDSFAFASVKCRRVEAASYGSLRLKLLKIGAWVRVSVRRVKIAMASAHPCQHVFALAHGALNPKTSVDVVAFCYVMPTLVNRRAILTP